LWRLFGIAAVTRNGQPARRWRMFLRQLLVWSPLLALFALDFAVPLFREPLLLLGLFVLAYLVMAVFSTLYAERTWPDRLVGTWLVMR
jgi:hypothetical protein